MWWHLSTSDTSCVREISILPPRDPFTAPAGLAPSKRASSCQGSWEKSLWRCSSVLSRACSLPLQAAVPIFLLLADSSPVSIQRRRQMARLAFVLECSTLKCTCKVTMSSQVATARESPRGRGCCTSNMN